MRISRFHLILGGLSLACGIAIFLFGDAIPFIRYSMGDFVIVIFIYCSIKAFLPKLASHRLALGVFTFSVLIEVLQYFDFPRLFGTDKIWVQIVLGSSFHWLDIVMYTAGTMVILLLENFFWQRRN